MKITSLILFLLCCLQASGQDHCQLANNYFEKGDYENATKNYNICQAITGKDMSAEIQKADKCFKTLIAADDYFKEKDCEKAKVRYKEVLDINPKDAYAKEQYEKCRLCKITIGINPFTGNYYSDVIV